jgi:hypothetical protein
VENIITLAGRDFVPLGESSIAHDIEVVRLMRVSGLEDPSLRKGETPEAYGWRVLQALIEAKALCPLMACLIVPAGSPQGPERWWLSLLRSWGVVPPKPLGTRWSLELAAQTSSFLGELDEPDDKRKVYGLVAELLFPFLRSGLGSWFASLQSSMKTLIEIAPLAASQVPRRGAKGSATGRS